ncbi:MAG: hypothetical protein E6767_07225 [Dysgonomonas sp.]|nr:hypothetical protein [Dysgonomonas sp.]
MTPEEFGKTEAETVLDSLLDGIAKGVDGKSYEWYNNLFPQLDVDYEFDSPEEHMDGILDEGTYRGIEDVVASEAIKHPELHAKMQQLVEKVTEINNKYRETWIDDEEHAATHFALKLALYDPKYIPLYTAFLDSNDLNHEVYQMFDISVIINKWGWIPETYLLYVTRWLTTTGQHAGEEIIEEDITEAMTGNEQQKTILMDAVKKYFSDIYQDQSSSAYEHKEDSFKDLIKRYIFSDDKDEQEDMLRRYKALVS